MQFSGTDVPGKVRTKEKNVMAAKQSGIRECEVESTSRVAQMMNIETDTERSIHRQAKSEDKASKTNQRSSIGPHDSSKMQLAPFN